jgi:hypothetical protein
MVSPMDIWLTKTNISSIPYCSAPLACESMFHAHFNAGNGEGLGADEYLGRMTCLQSVKVPDYYAGNMSDVSAMQMSDASGERYFPGWMCACDTTWDYSGPECSVGRAGVALVYMFLALSLWLVFMTLRLIALLGSGRLKSGRKRSLAIIALLLYVSEFSWILSTRAAISLVPSQAVRSSLQGFSHSTTTLVLFMFVCGMMLDTTVLIRKGSINKNASEERKLRRLELLFKGIPIMVTLLSAIGYFSHKTPASVMLIAFAQMSALLFVAATFTATIRVIDRRLRRLAPSETGAMPGTAGIGTQQSDQGQFLGFSKRLRAMALRMQLICVCVVLFGFVYVYALVARSAQAGVLVNVLFGIWLMSISCVPFVGLLELVEVKIKVSTNVFSSRGRGKDVIGDTPSNVESSDCGTLGE